MRVRRTGLRAGAGVLLVVAGCGSPVKDANPAVGPSAAPASSAAPDPQAGERAAVLAAYRAMAVAEERSYAAAKLDPELARYAADKALAAIQATVFWHQQDGTTMRGTVKRRPVVTALDTASDPLRATVTDCADTGDYNEIKTADGSQMPYEGSRRHVVTSSAQRTRTVPWQIYTSTIERDHTC